ncbi:MULTISPECIES: glycosyltransferase [unclassified Marinobacterium]|uniref:glycosyltransferase n=1 Tax=unclassified Marinobacterium TaxID=2644139 RepID=UPI0015683224|nr:MULTISPECIES: glycosyltransferase [unclassified Marinobacterium]NRP46005.1 N-glycosyltransferase [Marinobacterium sp. xm-d-543]NRQ22345.1 N-glycosyltransferase [Marinobacterium sp. xm-m-312]
MKNFASDKGLESGQTPSVAILIRSMDRNTLDATLASVRKQTYQAINIYLVNATGQPHSAIADNYSVNFLESDQQLHRPDAANVLLAAATQREEDYALFLDDDDLIAPRHIENLVYALQLNPGCIAAYSDTVMVVEQGGLQQRSVKQEPWSRESLLLGNIIPIHSCLFDLAKVSSEGIRFDTAFTSLEDWDFWLSLSKHGEFIHVPSQTALYRVFMGLSGMSADRDVGAYSKVRQKIYEKHLGPLHSDCLVALTSASDLRDRLKYELNEVSRHNSELHSLIMNLNSEVTMLTSLLRPKNYLKAGLRRLHRKVSVKKAVTRGDLGEAPSAVSVIVPVYKGLEETQACINSVIESAPFCKTKTELVVINDCSPEPEVTEWLRIDAKRRNYLLLENDVNLGFVATVNRGMRETNNDVVLLNSDAEVSNDWLDRMLNAAYSYPEPVSSVTPFSNNATICSFPGFCEDNDLMFGKSVFEIDEAFKRCNHAQVVEVPTAIGFCMYITRSSLNDAGLFDVEKFGKGYGEENEFCLRTAARGWKHLHALDTFVWHKGSVSFGDEVRDERASAALQIIEQDYPSYSKDVHRFIALDPAKRARVNAALSLFQSVFKTRGLIVTHDRGGGVAQNIDDLVSNFDSIGWCQLKPAEAGTVRLELLNSGSAIALKFELDGQFELLIELLDSLGFSFIHWHHHIGLPAKLNELPALLNVPSYFTIHDYYTVCPQISLSTAEGKYCGEPNIQACEQCVAKRPVVGCSSVAEWRDSLVDWMEQQQLLIAPSKDCASRMSKYIASNKLVVVPHLDLETQVPVLNIAVSDRPLRVAVLGGMSKIKGADVLDDVARLCIKEQAPVAFKLFGHAYRSLDKSIDVTGRYQQDQLVHMLEEWKPDLVWFPAIWPETYSYTLSTAMALGLPIVATDIGAFVERLQYRGNTWLLSYDSTPQQWLDFFVEIQSGGCPVNASHSELNETVIKSEQAQSFYKEIYTKNPTVFTEMAKFNDLMQTVPAESFNLKSADNSVRLRVVGLLYIARTLPFLSPLMRRIPMSLQIWVKNKVLGYKP